MPEYSRKKKDQAVNLETLMGNKPPQALDVEAAVLGAMLVEYILRKSDKLNVLLEEWHHFTRIYKSLNRINYPFFLIICKSSKSAEIKQQSHLRYFIINVSFKDFLIK